MSAEQLSNIFGSELSAGTVFICLGVGVLSMGLYHSVFKNILKKQLEYLYFSTSSFESHTDRTLMYVFLNAVPMLTLTGISLFYNHSTVGLEISLATDEINLLLVVGYICWLEESRHTPIRGILLIRDFAFAVLSMGLLCEVLYSGIMSIDYALGLIGLFVVYYLTMASFEGVQNFILKVFGLKESNCYNAKYLLTAKNKAADFLEIKDIISERTHEVKEQLRDFQQILTNVEDVEEDQEVLMNFAKLFLPIKKANELKQGIENAVVLDSICQNWDAFSEESEDESESAEDNLLKHSPSWGGGSADGLRGYTLKNTYTDDFINEDQLGDEELGLYQKVLKYAYYPVHICSSAEGRLFYLVGYLGLALLFLSMFLMANSVHYVSFQMGSAGILSLLCSVALVFPSAEYYVAISSNHDYDFSNLFLQSMVLKTFTFGVFMTLYSVMFESPLSDTRRGNAVLLVARMVTMCVFLGFMAINRFATRFSNFKFFALLLLVSIIARVITENVINSVE